MALGLAAGAASAQAKLDCGKAYKGFWDKIGAREYAKNSTEAAGRRKPHGAAHLDACQAGDDQDARALFERLDKMKF